MMQLVFLGTGSQYPSENRGTSCTALRLENGHVWLFDCGEGSQIQLQKSNVRPGRITKIFITHLHGDHLFGLPGLLCSLGSWDPEKKDLLEIYGPSGLRHYIRNSLVTSRAILEYKFVVHELEYLDEQLPADWQDWPMDKTDYSRSLVNEEAGRAIQADDTGTWHLLEDERVSVKAGWIVHRVPCFGYVVHEKSFPGKLNAAKLPELGVPPGPAYGKLKSGEEIVTPEGQLVRSVDVIGPPRAGRKITILGDTASPVALSHIAMNSDVLVHEATLENALVHQAVQNGHSTPEMAANFCKQINARSLILTHYSQRYGRLDETGTGLVKKDQLETEDKNVGTLLEEAKIALGDFPAVAFAAEDLKEFDIHLPDQKNAVTVIS